MRNQRHKDLQGFESKVEQVTQVTHKKYEFQGILKIKLTRAN